ncbi:MFS transporter [Seinonella peptonophila]|nr:MFS transporter [Seinonella peptonophila]
MNRHARLRRVQKMTFVNSARAHFEDKPLPKQLQLRGMQDLFDVLMAVGACVALLSHLFVLLVGERIGIRKLTVIAFSVTSTLPFLMVLALENHDSTLILILKVFSTIAGAFGVACVGAMLRAAAGDDPVKHQQAVTGNTLAWAVGSVLGNSTFLLVDPNLNPVWLWVWAGIDFGLNVMTIGLILRIPEVRPKVVKNQKADKITKKERALLVGRSMSCVVTYMAFTMVSAYASLFIDQTWLAWAPMVTLLVMVPLGSWLAVRLQKWLRKMAVEGASSPLWHWLNVDPKNGLIEKMSIMVGLFITCCGFALAASAPYQLVVLVSAIVLLGLAEGLVSNPLGFLIKRSTEFQTAQAGAHHLSVAIGVLFVAGIGRLFGESGMFWLCGVPSPSSA